MKQRALSLALALSLISGMSVAHAADTTMDANSSTTLTVMSTDPEIFAVTVPSEIPINMDKNGIITVANNLNIKNDSAKAVKVTAISVTGNNGWTITEFNADASTIADDIKELALQFRGDGTTADGTVTLTADNWSVSAGDSLPLNVAAKLPAQTTAMNKAQVATVNWTIDWADSTDVIPPTAQYTITVRQGANGSVTPADPFQTDSTGKIAAFPIATPNAGYKFDHWEDESGNAVTTDTVFTADTTIQPVFVVDAAAPSPANWFTTNGIDTITGLSDTYLNMVDAPTELVLPSNIGGTTITTIGSNAFMGKNLITKITIPSTITSIEASAFRGCSAITSVILPEGLISIGDNAFDGTGITQISLPKSNTTIGSNAFGNMSGLVIDGYATQVDKSNTSYPASGFTYRIAAGVRTIPTGVFNHTSVSSVILPANFESIGDHAFEGTVNLKDLAVPDSCVSIGDSAFKNSGIEFFTFPSNPVTIGSNVFEGSNIASVVFSDNVDTISRGMFQDTTKLANLEIPATITTIEDDAFLNSSITTLVLNDGLTSIGANAFKATTSLGSVTIPGTVKTMKDSAFEQSGITSATLEEGAVITGVGVFNKCTSLTTVGTLPESVTTIPHSTFRDCTSLKTVASKSGITTIGPFGFYNCQSITWIDNSITSSVEHIGSSAYYNCGFGGTAFFKLKTIGSSAFENCRNMTSFHIPSTIESIGANALKGTYMSGAGRLNIGYQGTEAEWNSKNITGQPWGYSSHREGPIYIWESKWFPAA